MGFDIGGQELDGDSWTMGANEVNDRRLVEVRGRLRLLLGFRIMVLEVIGVDGNVPRTDTSNSLSSDFVVVSKGATLGRLGWMFSSLVIVDSVFESTSMGTGCDSDMI